MLKQLKSNDSRLVLTNLKKVPVPSFLPGLFQLNQGRADVRVHFLSGMHDESETCCGTPLEQLLHRIPIADTVRLPLQIMHHRARIDAQAVKDRRGNVADVHRPFLRIAADPVR